MKSKKKIFSALFALAVVFAVVQIPGAVRANEAKNLADVLAGTSSKTIILGTEGAYVEAGASVEIPSGKTVIIPYKDGIKRANQANGDGQGTMAGTAYSTLELKDGAKLVVNGTLIIGSLSGPSGNAENVITGGYGEIVTGTGSVIEVNGTLTNYGIVSGKGELIAKSGAEVTDLYSVFNYRGGNYTLNLPQKYSMYPLNETGCDNIQIKSTYQFGASLIGETKVYGTAPVIGATYGTGVFCIIGEGGIFRQGEDGCVVKELVGELAEENAMSNERITFVDGGAMSDSTLELTVAAIVNTKINSRYFMFPISGKTDVVVDSGVLRVEHGFKFLPGSTMKIKEGATLLLDEEDEMTQGSCYYEEGATSINESKSVPSTGFLVFYEGGEAEGTFGAAEKNMGATRYASGTDAAKLIVDGTLTVINNGYIAGAVDATDGVVNLSCEVNQDETITFESKEAASTNHNNMIIKNVYTNLTWNEVANVNAGQHSVESWNTTEPTCDTEGSKVGYCTACGQDITEVIPATGHTYVNEEAVEPTCTSTGKTAGSYCSVCNEVFVKAEEIPMVDHQLEKVEKIEATCTTPAYADGYKCKNCDYIEGITEIEGEPALGHLSVAVEEKLPTCTEAGHTAGEQCERCGEILSGMEVDEAHKPLSEDLEHKYETVPAKAATCLEAGYSAHEKCRVCGETKGYEAKVALSENLQHTTVVIEAKAPTCTQKGLTEGAKCSVCGEILKAQQELPAIDHSYEWKVVKEPTKYMQGLESGTCSECGKVEFNILDKVTENNSGTGNTNTSGNGSSTSGGSSSSSKAESADKNAADTDDNTNIFMLLSLCVVSLGLAIYIRRRRTELV